MTGRAGTLSLPDMEANTLIADKTFDTDKSVLAPW